MCKLKSGLLFKNGVFVPDYDSHDKMLREKCIEDTAENRIAGKFVRFELSPENDDPFVPIDMWVFKIDQDELPEWIKSDPEKYEAMARAAVKEWAEKHIFIGIDKLNLTDGSGYYLKDCTNVTLSGSSTVQDMRGSSTVQDMWDSSTVQDMWGSSTVRNMRDSSTVRNMRDSSTVQDMRDSSTVRNMWGSSTVQDMRGSSTVRNMWGSSTVQDMRGSSTVQDMWDSSTVQDMWGSSTVRNMRDSSTVQDMSGSSTVQIAENLSKGVNVKTIILSQNAIIKDCRTKTLYAVGDWKLSIKEASDA
ncbi:MAG: hypothetical protein ACLS9Y_04670 [Ruthenibacterium lactatiformans]